MNPRVPAAAATALLSAGTVVATAPPASAGTPVLATANIGITFPTPTTFKVCAAGFVEGGATVAGEWIFGIQGARADGTLINVVETETGPAFNLPCQYVSTNSTLDGSFTASLYFAGDGSSSATTNGIDTTEDVPEVVAGAVDEAHWTPQQGANGINT